MPSKGLVPSWTPPPPIAPQHSDLVANPWQIPKALPLTRQQAHQDQKKMVQMKEQIKAPEKNISDEEIVNLSDARFKTLVIRCSQKWLNIVTK